MHTYVCENVFISICIKLYEFTYRYINKYVCIYIYIFIYMYAWQHFVGESGALRYAIHWYNA